MRYRNYDVQLTEKQSKMIVELKSEKDYIFYLYNDLNLVSFDWTIANDEKLTKQFKLIVDKRIIEKTMFNCSK